jgi:hypothetical protein
MSHRCLAENNVRLILLEEHKTKSAVVIMSTVAWTMERPDNDDDEDVSALFSHYPLR